MKTPFRYLARTALGATLLTALLGGPLLAQVQPAPDRPAGEGEGPFERLIIRGATLIDGTGSPPIGPVDIVVEGNRIQRIANVGVPMIDIDPGDRPEGATREIDATGKYVMPGFVDLHLHTGGDPVHVQAVDGPRDHDRARRGVRSVGLLAERESPERRQRDHGAPHVGVPTARAGLGAGARADG
jgi:hypothetical protein